MDGNDHPAHTEFEQIQPEISALFHGGSLLLTVVFDIIANEIVRLFGDLPRIELFARDKKHGWDVWGNEVESSIVL
jgi:hypothetical protein